MTISSRQRVILLFAFSGVIVVGLSAWIFLAALPHLHALRATVDNRRATIAAIQDQQSNLVRLQQQTSSITELGKQLDQDIWTFLQEDAFFDALANMAKVNGVTVDDPKIKDVTPTGRPLARPATLTLRGPTANLLKALDALQQTKPLIGIQSVVMSTGQNASITVTANTVWQ